MPISLTYTGIAIAVGGTFLVNTLGISDACSSELTAKAVEYAPLVIGAITSIVGRIKIGKKVAVLREQVGDLGSMPRA